MNDVIFYFFITLGLLVGIWFAVRIGSAAYFRSKRDHIATLKKEIDNGEKKEI